MLSINYPGVLCPIQLVQLCSAHLVSPSLIECFGKSFWEPVLSITLAWVSRFLPSENAAHDKGNFVDFLPFFFGPSPFILQPNEIHESGEHVPHFTVERTLGIPFILIVSRSARKRKTRGARLITQLYQARRLKLNLILIN